MYRGYNIGKEMENMRYLYNLITNDGKNEYKDEYICSFQIVNNYSVRILPKKYINLYLQLIGVGG